MKHLFHMLSRRGHSLMYQGYKLHAFKMFNQPKLNTSFGLPGYMQEGEWVDVSGFNINDVINF